MADALKRWDEATSTWVTVAAVNRIVVQIGGGIILAPYGGYIIGSINISTSDIKMGVVI